MKDLSNKQKAKKEARAIDKVPVVNKNRNPD